MMTTKKLQTGFAPLLLIIILAVVVLGGVLGYYLVNQANTNLTTDSHARGNAWNRNTAGRSQSGFGAADNSQIDPTDDNTTVESSEDLDKLSANLDTTNVDDLNADVNLGN